MFDRLKSFIKERKLHNNVIAPGWDAIEEEFLKIYPGQNRPKHYGVTIPWTCGGSDPLDGISIYDGGSFWHFVTFGLTELYAKESDNEEFSGYGYEMTFKLKKSENDEQEIADLCKMFQRIARNTFNKNEIFHPYERLYVSKDGIDSKLTSKLVGFICINDPSVNSLNTVNGKVAFIEFIGATEDELNSLTTKDEIKEFYKKLGTDITDLKRDSII